VPEAMQPGDEESALPVRIVLRRVLALPRVPPQS
jgi:hypothetical protein